jgi:arylsulfatase A-like enzyme
MNLNFSNYGRLLLSAFCLLPGFIAFAGFASPLAAEQLTGSRPNIILVMTDDQGYAQLGRHGHPWIHTPNLDELFDRSTRFTAFHVDPTCSPTRSALLTGRYPFKNGVSHTILERERLTLRATTLAQLLKQAGYHTGIFGKWHLGDEEPYQPQQRGFDETFIHGAGGIGQAYDCSCADAPHNNYFDPVIRHNGKFEQTKGFCTDVFFIQALGWIKSQRNSKEPFFAYITPNAPHGPYFAPDAYKKPFLERGFRQASAGFYGMIENIDANVGLLLSKLAEWKLEENTLVIFLSDNGTTAGGPGAGVVGRDTDGTEMHFYNAGMKGLKGSIDEGGTHVPAFFYWKGHLPPGCEIDRIAAHIDLLPTLVALAGGEVPSELNIDGRNLLSLLADPKAAWPDRNLFFHIGRWEKGSNPDDAKFINYAVRNQQYRLTNNKELFDIEADPGQTHDVAAKHPEVVAAMRADYEKFWAEMRPLLVNEEVPLSKTRPYFFLFEQQKAKGGIPAWEPPEL